MHTRIVPPLLALIVVAPLHAQIAPPASPPRRTRDAAAELRHAIRGLDEAAVRDPDALEGFLADGYVFTGPDGATVAREQLLAGVRSGALRFLSYRSDSLDVRVLGGSAVVRGRVEYEVEEGGGRSARYLRRFTSTWVRDRGRWRAVAWHASDIAPRVAPPLGSPPAGQSMYAPDGHPSSHLVRTARSARAGGERSTPGDDVPSAASRVLPVAVRSGLRRSRCTTPHRRLEG